VLPFKRGDCHDRYHTPEYHQACTQIINDLNELFFSEGRCYLDEIEQILIRNLDDKFTRVAVADLTGLSTRTIRNKLNERL